MDNDIESIRKYVSLHSKHFMTEFELRCYKLGARMAKAAGSPFEDVREKVSQMWDDYEDSAVKQALADGFCAFRSQLVARLVRDAVAGELHINRCPK